MRGEITKEQLVKVAHLLDGWKYHDILSEDPKEYGHWLSNGTGQFINVNYAYGETLPRWSLQYIHPKYKTKQTAAWIGCSLHKSLKAIAADVRLRLLSAMPELYRKLEDLTEKHGQDIQAAQVEEYMISALNRVLRLNEYYDHRFARAFLIKSEEGNRIARIKKFANKAQFQMTLEHVTPEQIIQIMQLVNGSALR